jgi:hypothetical protein
MTQQNYSLDIISHHSNFKNKSLRKYYVDGIDTIGAWGDEPFEIKFANHTYQKVQVKISLDGTDVLSGAPANTNVDNNMWVVNGYGTMSLKAWPETNHGGAAFVFTSANNSVAVHTHGDLSARGIIAVAVFVEGHVEPIRYNLPPIVITQPVYPHYPSYYLNDYWWENDSYKITCNNSNATFSSNVLRSNVMNNSNSVVSTKSCSFNSNDGAASGASKSLESLAAVGAGQHVDQKINYTQGLIKPVFTETVRVRYVWYDDLVKLLQTHNVPAPHASGFPGDKNKVNINLGKTPRIGGYNQPAFPREIVSYSRVV